ncbi:MAG: c-type cytochrome [Alphaproteobacteria bacterium]|nr:c-type cytochrome [Alphaproteobacteria bacterium]
MSLRTPFALVGLLLSGCGPGADPDTGPPLVVGAERPPVDGWQHPTGSTPLTSDATGFLYNVNLDSGSLTRIDPFAGTAVEVDVGVEPSRVALGGDALYVTLRGERSVVRVDIARFDDGPVSRVELGAEPLGVVASPDGSRVYVALAIEAAIVELDGDLRELRRFPMPGEPRYLALHPGGEALFVGSARVDAPLARIDIASGAVQTVPLPETERHPMVEPDAEPAEPIPLDSRITGDPWVTPDGSTLLVPVLYLDTVTPIMALSSVSEIPNDPPDPEIPAEPNPGGYGGTSFENGPIEVVDRVTPAVVSIPLDVAGAVAGEGEALLAVAAVDAVTPGLAGSYISSVSTSPDGQLVVATMEASRATVLLDRSHVRSRVLVSNRVAFLDFHPSEELEAMGFSTPATVATTAGEGPNGAVFVGEDELYVHNAFSGTVTRLDLGVGRSALSEGEPSNVSVPTIGGWPATNPVLGSYVSQGRSRFYSARTFEMGNTGVSCSTCHFEGRNDGVTWTFDDGPRQTPSLAGRVSETAPVTWRSGVPSVADEARITIQGRFFAPEPPFATIDSIAAFVDTTRLPDTPDLDPAAVARGAVLFDASGCSVCHSGDRHTDRTTHEIRGVELDTPSLSGIVGSAPYLHDGSAQTLRDVLELGRDGSMGFTAGLSESQMQDLVAYLKSL